jgi:hypothetical protein
MSDTVDRIARLLEPILNKHDMAVCRGTGHINLLEAIPAAIEAEVIAPLLKERDKLNAECERAWEAYRIAHNQAMANGEALIEASAALQTGGE